ncbi:MAG: glycosyltransferase family 39 protein [Chloroflexi bacterium]|nr:glycosyltransferase family 39 protein [Chloroflexota bacterium]MCI0803091.1 glycosyltransferase family 39 protein [Chloroflexota bacterium]MCI0835017.1 glycosyltransferase family 39 protein [Chloroflexota bacterium]MCI0835777.1 glycosyltransferase family 39 protein [Chloroflexota bacterium]MCI0851388.1 glycosyltransferase family 39 protein [Chloroflexota bacterium]
MDRRTALIAALIVALNPTLILYSGTLGSESLFVYQLLLITWLAIRVIEGLSSTGLLLIGELTGFAILARPIAISVPFIAFGAHYMVNRRDLRRTTINFAVVLVISALIVSPWIARNARAMGLPTLQSSSGLNMWIGHGPQATGGWMDAPPVPGDFRSKRAVSDFARLREAIWRSEPIRTTQLRSC